MTENFVLIDLQRCRSYLAGRPWYAGSLQEQYSCKLYQDCQSNDTWLKITENLKLTEYFFKSPHSKFKTLVFNVFLVLSLLYREI